MKKALITGITGQDGSYLAELLIKKKYEVHGIIRRASSFNTQRIDHIYQDQHEYGNPKMVLHYGDITDSSNINRLLEKIVPDEIYHLAAQSHVGVSFQVPEYTADVDGVGTLRLLDGIKEIGIRTKFYQASTSELYGKVREIPQTELTPFYPRSPYAAAKLYAHWVTINYREAYNIFASNGILFNHESPRRGETFVTRKITRAVGRMAVGLQKILYLGNLDAKRDWGYAPEFVEAMWRILQHKIPDDFVIATGQTHSVREFIINAFENIGIIVGFTGEKENEECRIIKLKTDNKDVTDNFETGQTVVKIDPRYYRPTEVDLLIGNPDKANTELGWKPEVSFEELVRIMVKSDWGIAKKEKLLIGH